MSRKTNLKVWAAALLAAVAAAAMVVALGFTSPAQAANAGDLDTSFDGDGRVVFDVFGGVGDSAQAVAIQRDGKLVLAGSWCGFGAGCTTAAFAIARFNPDGSLDTAFGSGGRTLGAFPNGWAQATDVAIQSDGKIVAAGWRNDDDGVNDADFALVRLETDGDLDPSFSGDGKVITTFGGSDGGEAVTIQGDGKIVVAGSTTGCGGDDDFALARYNTDGSLDTTFSGDGKVCTGFGSDREGALAVAMQTNAAPGDHRTRIVVAGTTDDDDCPLDCDYDFALARYHANGSLDTSFGGDGKVTTGLLSSSDVAAAVAIQTDGRIVAAGHTTNTGDYDFALARYNTDGSLDGSFEGGTVVTEMGEWDEAEAVAIQADGRIVAAGWSGPSQWDPGFFALSRYRTDGSLDASFSGDGRLRTSFGGDALAKDVAMQSDGRIVAAGSTNAGGDYDFAIARYHAITDNTPPDTTITGGPPDATFSTSVTFAFVSSELGSRFQCSFDGAPFSECSSPKSYSNLIDGSHLFRVRAIDAAGNIDPTPAQRTFTVDTIAPKVSSNFPAENATGVAPAVNVQATFSEAMRAGSITTDTIKLFRAGTTTPIGGVVSYDAQTKTATLNPNIDLRLGSRYKAVVSTGTRDLASNRLDQDQVPTNGNQSKMWFFTVRD
jgi:uncharacterized delta-60 repeat protein